MEKVLILGNKGMLGHVLYEILQSKTYTKKYEVIGVNRLKINTDQNSQNNFMVGLITNLFNVKAFIFFVSLFTILIESLDGIYFYLYPIYFSLTTAVWFSLLSLILTSSKFKYVNIYNNFFIKSLFSLILSLIGLYIIFTSIYEYF